METTKHKSTRHAENRQDAGHGQTRNSLLIGIITWFLHLNSIYGLNSVACKWSWFSSAAPGVNGLRLVQVLLTLVAMGVISYQIFRSWQTWRAFQTEKPSRNEQVLHDTEKDRRPLAAFIVLMLNAFFLLYILAIFVPVLALNACFQG